MDTFDDAVLDCFLENQGKLFPEPVAINRDEAEAFLIEAMAVVVNGAAAVKEYFLDEGIDCYGLGEEELLEAEEVFDVGDGRYLIIQ